MLTKSRFLNGGSPSFCHNCAEPFPIVDGHKEAYRGKDNAYYCSEACCADGNEAHALRLRVAS